MSEWIAEALGRAPMKVTKDTDPQSLASEFEERLAALLASHNGLEPTPEGWRDLAIALALRYEPAFKIETPEDRESLGGRPVGWGDFALRSQMKKEMRDGKTQAAAARVLNKKSGISVKTAQNVMTKQSQAPDFMRRLTFEIKAAAAAKMAAQKLSQE